MKQLEMFVKRVFRDKHGNLYTPREVVFCDIDTPGPQYFGYVTKESFDKTNCIDNWVAVKIRGDIDIDKIETELIDGGNIVKGVHYHRQS